MMDNVFYDLQKTLQEAGREECYFLAGIFEAVLVHGVWKLRRDEDDGVS